MYDEFKKKLLTIQLPIFILRYVLFEILLVMNEYLMDDIYQCLTNNIQAHQSKEDYLKKSQIFSSFGHFGLRFWIHVLILSILFINVIEFIMIFVTGIVGRFRIFRRLITWETILVLFTSSYLTFVQLRILRQLNQEHSQWEDFKSHSIQLRYA